jgi:amino acid transporter
VIVGLLVPFTHPRLMGHDQSPRPPPSQGQPPPSQGQPPPIACASPFVIATQNAGLGVLPSIINGVILATVLSVANSSVYGSTRTLNAMALQGQAPKIFKYIDTKGRPMTCHALALGFGLLAYLAQLSYPWVAFMWFLALSGLSSVITWTSICYAHIRFRTAWTAQGNSPNNLPFRSPFGIVGSWIGLFLNASIILMQLVAAIFPIGHQNMPLCMRIRTFFSLFTTFPLVVLFYFVYKWCNGTVVRNPRLEHHGDCLICPPHLESGAVSTTGISAISSSCPFVDLSQKDELPNGSIEEPEKWWWKTCPDSIRRLLVRLKFPWY